MLRHNLRFGFSFEYAVFLKENEYYIGNVGLINVSEAHNHADISYYIDKDYMNRGYATEAAEAMVKFGFEELGLHKISGVCMSCNSASRRVMEKLGMKYEGTLRDDMLKNGKFLDLDHLSLLRDEYFTNGNNREQ